jgi:pimeloyl-ACP methyl ester carboxylesterase
MHKESLILMHGALGAGSQLTLLSSRLSENYDVRILEFDGHGFSRQEPDVLSLDHFSRQLSGFIDSAGLIRPHVFGYSLGGYVALYHAHHHPGILGRIITLGTKYDWTPKTVEEQFGFLDPEKIKNEIPQLQQTLIQLHGDQWENLVIQTRRFVGMLGNNPAVDEKLCNRIQNQVLILRGEKDRMVGVNESASVAAWLPHGRFETLAETPHPIERVDMERLSRVILQYLAE